MENSRRILDLNTPIYIASRTLANFKDDNEVRMRHYMQMTTYFIKKVNLFPITDQVEEDESTAMDPWCNVVANLLLPLIDWDEQEVDDLDILIKPIKARTKEWVDGKISQLK